MQADVEGLCIVIRKGVVKERVLIGERDFGAHMQGDHMRDEGFALMRHGSRSRGSRRRARGWLQPDHHARIIEFALAGELRIGQFDFPRDGSRPGHRREAKTDSPTPGHIDSSIEYRKAGKSSESA